MRHYSSKNFNSCVAVFQTVTLFSSMCCCLSDIFGLRLSACAVLRTLSIFSSMRCYISDVRFSAHQLQHRCFRSSVHWSCYISAVFAFFGSSRCCISDVLAFLVQAVAVFQTFSLFWFKPLLYFRRFRIYLFLIIFSLSIFCCLSDIFAF